MAKTQFLKYFEDWLTKIKVRTEVYEKFEKQKVFISSQIYKGHKNHCTYCHTAGI